MLPYIQPPLLIPECVSFLHRCNAREMRPSHDDDQKYLSGPSTRFSSYKMVLSSPSLLLLKLIFHDEIGRYLVLGYAAESTVLTHSVQVFSFFILSIISFGV